MKKAATNKGFTFVELLIALAIFATFLTGIVTLMVDLYRTSKRITLEEQVYQDMRAIMNHVVNYVGDNAIDYEEYYRDAIGGEFLAKGTTYTYGDYSKLFYDFGSDGVPGAQCNAAPFDPALNPGCVINKTTLDTNRGQHPFDDDPLKGNAFCGPSTGGCGADLSVYNKQDNLFLINEAGDKKTVLALETVEKTIDSNTFDEKTLSLVWLYGSDTDRNDVIDEWTVGPEFIGTGGAPITDAGLIADIDPGDKNPPSEIYENFIPVSPLRTNIVDLKFYVTPLEDPYKAFAETASATETLIQPHVTVVLTVEPSVTETQSYLGPIPRKTLQTTIYSGVKQEVVSY
ncbi:type II secretion system protein [Patescibacteria group bacterium]